MDVFILYVHVQALLGEIAIAAQAISHIPTLFYVAWSICRLSVTFLHPA